MRYNKLDLNLLTALRALLLERNVTRAAESMHLTQSAMSSALSRLRQYFDDPLIVQVGRTMELTPLAVRLEKHVSDVLLHIDTAICARAAFDPASSDRHYTIVASEYATAVVLRDALEAARRIAPGVGATILHPTRPTAEELENRDTDFVITLRPYAEPSQPLEPLFGDRDVIVVDAANSLVGERLSLEDYLALGHVTYRVAHFGLTMFEQVREQRAQGSSEIVVDSFHLVPRFVLGTDRIATLPWRLARQYVQGFPLRLVEPDFDIPPIVEVLQWHRYRDYDPACVWFREVVRNAAGNMPPL